MGRGLQEYGLLWEEDDMEGLEEDGGQNIGWNMTGNA